jgi:hypothetical protein
MAHRTAPRGSSHTPRSRRAEHPLRHGDVVNVPATQSRYGAGMQARAHFGAPPLHALVVARGGLPGIFAVTRNGPSCQSQPR